MNTPQIIYCILLAISLLFSARDHGKEKTYLHDNFWRDLLAQVLLFTLLYYGGFFNN